MRVCLAHAAVFVQNGIGEAHMFLLPRAPWAEPNGSVYYELRWEVNIPAPHSFFRFEDKAGDGVINLSIQHCYILKFSK